MSFRVLGLLTGLLLAGTTSFAQSNIRNFTCRCYGEPGHRFAGDMHVMASGLVEAARKADPKCKAQAWGMYGTFKYSMDTCFTMDPSEMSDAEFFEAVSGVLTAE
jgi:hypothetical protein